MFYDTVNIAGQGIISLERLDIDGNAEVTFQQFASISWHFSRRFVLPVYDTPGLCIGVHQRVPIVAIVNTIVTSILGWAIEFVKPHELRGWRGVM